jgi:AraC-like DNA-binding protein
MNFQRIIPDKSVSLFVNQIWVFEHTDQIEKTNLPFFADGYPGLMFQQTENGLIVNPHKKAMPVLFLYGQTIKPIELEMVGAYKIIIFQLYPFVLKSFFDVTPQTINDNCYDLSGIKELDVLAFSKQLINCASLEQQIQQISHLLLHFFERKKEKLDFKIKQAIEAIIVSKGKESIKRIATDIKINNRTLERRFLNETGLSPKQFARIIQFQSSLEQLTVKDFNRLTDVVYENGFSDQSHFIRVFKAFTGKTPKAFQKL